jgi:hypothetical protein
VTDKEANKVNNVGVFENEFSRIMDRTGQISKMLAGQKATRENPEDETNMYVDFLLHLIKECAPLKEIHARAIRVAVNYLGHVLENNKVKVKDY